MPDEPSSNQRRTVQQRMERVWKEMLPVLCALLWRPRSHNLPELIWVRGRLQSQYVSSQGP